MDIFILFPVTRDIENDFQWQVIAEAHVVIIFSKWFYFILGAASDRMWTILTATELLVRGGGGGYVYELLMALLRTHHLSSLF